MGGLPIPRSEEVGRGAWSLVCALGISTPKGKGLRDINASKGWKKLGGALEQTTTVEMRDVR